MKITELKDRRETYGHDGRAINRHSIRVYRLSGVNMEFILNRTLDGCPPFFDLCCFRPDSPLPRSIKVDGEEYWGGGLSWQRAERQAFKAIAAFMEARR